MVCLVARPARSGGPSRRITDVRRLSGRLNAAPERGRQASVSNRQAGDARSALVTVSDVPHGGGGGTNADSLVGRRD